MPQFKATDSFNRVVIFDIPERFDLLHQAGAGVYGVVCAAKDLMTGDELAIKKVAKNLTHQRDALKVLREIRVLKHLISSPNIIQLKTVFQSSNGDIYVGMELMATDLAEIINKQQTTPEVIPYLAFQIVRGVKIMHDAGIMHRDLKPQNILVSSDCTIKICDFGMSRDDDPEIDKSEYVITRWYRAPEIILQAKKYTRQVDVFSIGCIVGEMYKGKPLFPGRDYFDQLRRILALIGHPDEDDIEEVESVAAKDVFKKMTKVQRKELSEEIPNAPPEVLEVLLKMLAFNPKKRYTAAEALEHPFFAEQNDEDEDEEPREPIGPFDSSFEELRELSDIKEELKKDIEFFRHTIETGNNQDNQSNSKNQDSEQNVN